MACRLRLIDSDPFYFQCAWAENMYKVADFLLCMCIMNNSSIIMVFIRLAENKLGSKEKVVDWFAGNFE